MESSTQVIIASSSHCGIYDSENGNQLTVFKSKNNASVAPKTLAVLGESFLIGASEKKTFLNIWPIGRMKDDVVKFPSNGPVTCLTMSSCGMYCAAAIDNTAAVWKVTTGDRLGEITRHYTPISCIRFSSDDMHLMTGGEDGNVMVWLASHIIDVNKPEQVKPRFLWSNHTSAVTDIYPGMSGLVATSSIDCTCNIYELEYGQLITTISGIQPITSVLIDTCECFVVMGTVNGCIMKRETYDYNTLPDEVHFEENEKNTVKAHGGKVTCLAINPENETVLSASEDKTVKVWDLEYFNLKFTIEFDACVQNAFFAPKPPSLVNDKFKPSFVIKTFKKDMGSSLDLNDPELRSYEIVTPRCAPESKKSNFEMSYDGQLLDAMTLRTRIPESLQETAHEDLFESTLNALPMNQLRSTNSQMYAFTFMAALDQKGDRFAD